MKEFILEDYEENYAPPELPVLRVAVVDDVVFLDICEHEETSRSVTLTVKERIAVHRRELLRDLDAAIQSDQEIKARGKQKRKSA